MLPPEKDDGNIEYKRYILLKNKEIDSNNYNDIELKELIPLLKDKIYNKKDDEVTIDDIKDFNYEIEKKRLKSSLRFNQLASQMKYRIGEGDGVAIYYLGVNDNGSIYELNKKEKTDSINNIRELVKFIGCKIDKIIFIDTYIKVIIKDKKFKKLKEKNILLLGDTESGKTTFLSYLIKDKLDNKYSKARLHILNHKHEIESGRTSSFTCKYIDFNETNFVFIDSPGWDGINLSDFGSLNMKSSKKRNKLLLSFSFDLIIFFDKPNVKWYKKDFYLEFSKFLGIPSFSINLFDENCYINLINPIPQEQILIKFYSLFKKSKKEITNNSKLTDKKSLPLIDIDGVNNLLEKMDYLYPDDDTSNSLFFNNDYKRKLKNIFSNSKDQELLNDFNLLNLTLISSYPHQDLGLILSGYLSDGKLTINKKLYCYMDIKIDNDLESEIGKLSNPLEVVIKSIHKDGISVDSIEAPSIITISIDCCNEYGKKILDVYGDFSKLLRFKDIQVNFLSNFSYKPETSFKLIWLFYIENYNKLCSNGPSIPINSTIQIIVKNQLINLKKINNGIGEHYISSNLKKERELFNIDNQNFIYENLDSWGFGKIISI